MKQAVDHFSSLCKKALKEAPVDHNIHTPYYLNIEDAKSNQGDHPSSSRPATAHLLDYLLPPDPADLIDQLTLLR
jgi:hypothetical protein